MQDVLRLPFSGTRLREARERAGLTRPMLASKVAALGYSITPQHLARLERNDNRPRPDTLRGLVEALEINLDDLLDTAAAV